MRTGKQNMLASTDCNLVCRATSKHDNISLKKENVSCQQILSYTFVLLAITQSNFKRKKRLRRAEPEAMFLQYVRNLQTTPHSSVLCKHDTTS